MKKDDFVPRMFYKMLIPSVMSSLGFALSDMADALVVGRRMGETGLAAISLCLPIYMLMNVLMNAFGIGGSIRFSGLLGIGDKKGAVQCFNCVWKAALLSGLVFALTVNLFAPQVLAVLGAADAGTPLYRACETYMRIISLGAPLLILNIVFSNFLRNDNNEVLAARGFILGNITDLSLNILLVLVFDFGTAGAAVSTVLGSAVAVLCYLPAIIGKKRNVLAVTRAKTDFQQALSCFRIGFATAVQDLFKLIFLLVVNRTMLTLGGEGYVAVFDVVYNASFFIVYLCEGTAEAAQPLASTFAGERSAQDCRHVRRLSVCWALILSGIAAAILAVFAAPAAAVFGLSGSLLPTASYAIRVYCAGFACIAVNLAMSRYCQSVEAAQSAFVGVLLRSFLAAVPSVLLFSAFALEWIWFAFPAAEIVSLILFLLYCRAAEKKCVPFDENRIYRATLSGKNAELSSLLDGCEAFCEHWDAAPKQTYAVTLVIEEVVASIVRNVLGRTPDGKIRITLLALPDGDFALHVLDNATAFDPLAHRENNKTDFDIDEVGVTLIKKMAKSYLYRQCTGFNSLTVQI